MLTVSNIAADASFPTTDPGTDHGVSLRTSRRHRLERVRHIVAVGVSAVVLVATVGGWTPSLAAAVVIMITAVAIGMPHGALDVVTGPRLTKPIAFFVSYLALGAATVVVWLAAPLFGLVMFFAASWFHFARGDAEHHRRLGNANGLLGIATAGCAIGLPLALHSETVAPVLSELLLGTATLRSEQVATIGAIIAYPSIVTGVVAGIAAFQYGRTAAVVELVTIALLGVVVHPLVSFALYFSLWHSPRHLIALDVDRRAIAPTLGATAATLLAGAIAWFWIEPSTSVATQVVFIGLAALTAPHLAVTEMVRYRATHSGQIDVSEGARNPLGTAVTR
jgi:Brp/Blh family beta-carotene 15,15'-monooxygenase